MAARADALKDVLNSTGNRVAGICWMQPVRWTANDYEDVTHAKDIPSFLFGRELIPYPCERNECLWDHPSGRIRIDTGSVEEAGPAIRPEYATSWLKFFPGRLRFAEGLWSRFRGS